MSLLTDALKRAEEASQEPPYPPRSIELQATLSRDEEENKRGQASEKKRLSIADQALIHSIKRFLLALPISLIAAAVWWSLNPPRPPLVSTSSAELSTQANIQPNASDTSSIFSQNFRSTAGTSYEPSIPSGNAFQGKSNRPINHIHPEKDQAPWSKSNPLPSSSSYSAATEFEQGQDALLRHDLEAARAHFEHALHLAPKHPDILIALASVAEHQGRHDEALELRRRAEEADPTDPAVQAALLTVGPNVHQASSGDEIESRLKTLIADQSKSAPLHFALGNLHAHRHQWPDARQAYAEAIKIDPDHPDYLFNLAIALDHEHRARQATHYYRLSLVAAEHRPAAFAGEQARLRLSELAEQQ
jgi:tetratricopeptide (TPR) repeat protein